jgi:hypothetical protein
MFKGTEKMKGFTVYNANGMSYMVMPKDEGWFAVDSIDLTGVSSVNMMSGWQDPPKFGFDFEIRLDAPEGKSLGKGTLTAPSNLKQQGIMIHIPLQTVSDGQYHTIYVIAKPKAGETAQAGVVFMQFSGK